MPWTIFLFYCNNQVAQWVKSCFPSSPVGCDDYKKQYRFNFEIFPECILLVQNNISGSLCPVEQKAIIFMSPCLNNFEIKYHMRCLLYSNIIGNFTSFTSSLGNCSWKWTEFDNLWVLLQNIATRYQNIFEKSVNFQFHLVYRQLDSLTGVGLSVSPNQSQTSEQRTGQLCLFGQKYCWSLFI